MIIFTPNTVIRSTDINGNFDFLSKDAVSAISLSAGEITTTSSNWVDVDAGNIFPTITTKGGKLLVTAFAPLYVTALTGTIGVKIGANDYVIFTTNNTAVPDISSGTIVVSDIPAGTYVCKLRMKAQSGATAKINTYKHYGIAIAEI